LSGIIELGHVGLHAADLGVMREFYTDVMGLTITDEDLERGIVFLSSRPDYEHHELVLAGGRDVAPGAKVLQQLSWRVSDLASLQDYHRRFVDAGVDIEQVVTHGNAVGIYFFDPERNRIEVYWPTGVDVPQPFKKDVDISLPLDQLGAELERLVTAG
jgi:catechol-2,3-dioxygenase